MRRRPLLLLLLTLVCALIPSRASAHPADMYAQDQSIQLTRLGLQIDWKILPGPFLADAVWSAADADQNGSITPAEAQAWVLPFVSGLSITLDSQSAKSLRIQSIHWPAAVDLLRTGDDSVEVTLQMAWPAGLRGQHALELHNTHLESNSLNWFSLAAQDSLTFGQPDQDNGRLILDLFIPSPLLSTSKLQPSSPAVVLTSWTSGTPNLPNFTASLSNLAANLARSNSSPSNSPLHFGRSDSVGPENGLGQNSSSAALTALVKNAQASPLFLVSAILLSLALGSLHALTPGHGKALVGAYLVGSRGRTRDAVLLGGIVTLTHTGSVLILGLVTLLASHYILPSAIIPWLELISGLLVIAFGLNLLLQRRRDLRSPHAHDHSHPESLTANSPTRQPLLNDLAPSPLGGNNSTLASPSPSLALSPGRKYSSRILAPLRLRVRTNGLHDHDHHGDSHSNRQSLLALGISGGLVPCPDAIAILLVAVALNRVPFGMLLIVAFSLGLAAVLIGIGIAMLRGVAAIRQSSLLSRSGLLARFGAYAPVISALVVCGLGAGLTLNSWNSFKFSAAASAPVGATHSPSGLLYIASDSSDHDQLFMQPTGAASVQYTYESSGVTGYSISPDGKTIIYSVFKLDGGSSLWSLNADGSGRRLALDCPQAECNSPAWYPDGSKVAYERLESSSDPAAIPHFSIWWLDLASGKSQPVFQDASLPSSAPQFSPDGAWLSYVSSASNTLVAYNLKDARTLSVPLGSQAALPEAWSPDGSALLFGNSLQSMSTSENGSSVVAVASVVGPLHVKVYSLASGRITDLGGTHGETDFAASWSPNGKWIAINRNVTVTSSDPSVSSNQVWLVKPDGTQAHVLLNEGGASYSGLSWSPDSRLLLYSRYTLDFSAGSTGHFDILSTDVNTGQTSLLVPNADLARFLP